MTSAYLFSGDRIRELLGEVVDIFDETGETVGLATILTMVRKIDQTS